MDKKTKKFQPEMNLRSIVPKTQWGCKAMSDKNALIGLNENEFVASVGSRLVTFDNSSSQHRKTELIEPFNINTLSVAMMIISPDNRFLMTLVKFKDEDSVNTINMLIYQTDNKLLDAGTKRPRHIKYINNAFVPGMDGFEFRNVAFSQDSVYFACATNIPAKGIIVYDHFRERIVQTVSLDSAPCQVSFNSLDNSKICTIGEDALFKFWRFTDKSVHAAPVKGLKTGMFTFRCHRWYSPAEGGVVVAGTDNGNLFVIQSCAQKAPVVSAFGPNDVMPVENILIRGDIVLAVSGFNCIAAFEVRKVLNQRGANVLAANLVPIGKYRLTNIENITGIQWVVKESVNAFGIICTTTSNIFQHEILSDSDLASVGLPKQSEDAVPLAWTEVTNEKVLHSFHKDNIHTIALSAQNNTFVTGSYDDNTVRFWDFNHPYSMKACELIENFTEKPDENPTHLDMHPSGLFVVTACEYEVREYAITDSQLDMMRKISVKLPFTGPNGVPYLVTQPISIVRYSHGGQYLAVVTGKLAQVFHLYNRDYNSTNVFGSYSRVMIMCDHIAPITDLKFLRDDATIITTSTDGSVYSWPFGAPTRDTEYVCKGIAATSLAISKNRDVKDCTIVATFENQVEEAPPVSAPATASVQATKMRRQSSYVGARKMMTRTSTGLSGSNLSVDLETALNSPGKSVTLTLGTPAPVKRKCFLALWTAKISLAPKIIYVDTPIKAICLGDTDGVDKYEICVLGLEDGRILVSVLPFPFISLDPTTGGVPFSLSKPGTPQEKSASAAGNGPMVTTTASVHMSRASLVSGNTKKARIASDAISEAGTTSKASDLNSVGSLSNVSKNNVNDGELSVAGTAASVPSTPFGVGRDAESRHGMSTAGSVGGGGESRVGTTHTTHSLHGTMNAVSAAAVIAHTTPAKLLAAAGETMDILDESRCKVMRLHVGQVNQVVISANGMWIFTAGTDGTIFLLATSKRAFDYHEIPEQPESMENRYLVVDKKKLYTLKKRLHDIEANQDQAKKDNDMMIAKIIESKEKKENDLRLKMKTEINKRDEAIMLGRREYLQLKNIMKASIDKIHKEAQDKISDLELVYEKKLSQESLYLEKMRQAYDEYVVHTRMDLAEQQKKSQLKIEAIENEKLNALKEAEKQKGAVLQYLEYVKTRNDEVMNSLEEQQANERYKLKHDLAVANKNLQDHVNAQFSETVMADLAVSKLKMIIDNHQQEEMKLKSSVEWANNRIMQLEESLKNATTSLALKEEYNSKWEFRTGELQQKVTELEKIRKALTSQLHTLREELGPKEESLNKVTDKLQETGREYEMSLHALAEKEKELTHKGISISLLQKQVRELRNAANRKDQVLRRSSNLLDQYKFALQQAYFVSEKRTLPSSTADKTSSGAHHGETVTESSNKAAGGKKEKGKHHNKTGDEEVVEIVAQNQGMKVALKRLSDILAPYLVEGNLDSEMIEDMEQVQKEQERHMTLLHSNVSGLRANLDVASKVAATKVQNHLTDNQHLLKEVNALRLEVRSISMENQRLQAQLEFNATQKSHKEFLASQHKDFRGSYHHAGAGAGHTGVSGNINQAAAGAPVGATEVPPHKYARIPPEHERRTGTPNNRQELEAQNVKNFLMDNIEKSLLTISLQESAQYLAGGSRAISPSQPAGATAASPSLGPTRAGSAPHPQEPAQTIQDLNQKLHNLASSNGGADKPMTLAEKKIAALIEMNLHDIQANNERDAAASAGAGVGESGISSRKHSTSVKSRANSRSKPISLAGSTTAPAGAIGTAGGSIKFDDVLNMNSHLSSDSVMSLGTSQSSIQLGTAKFSLPPVHMSASASVKLKK